MHRLVLLAFLSFFSLLFSAHAQPSDPPARPSDAYRLSERPLGNFTATGPDHLIGEGTVAIAVQALNEAGQPDTLFQGAYPLTVNGTKQTVTFVQGNATLEAAPQEGEIRLEAGSGETQVVVVRQIPAWLSLVPPLIAIVMALVFREVIISLFVGIFTGALILEGFAPSRWIPALFTVIDRYIINALNDTGHLSVIVFSLCIGGMVAIISRNGGMAGIVQKLSRYARSARSSQLVTWFLGIAIFFDDYANTLIVGNTMRPVTDRYRISREKLAYIVDSTAAPVSAVAFVTTWIGAEIGYIKDATEVLGIAEGAYSMFLSSLRFAFYPLFTLAFIFMLVWMRRDFGTMRKAEQRARLTGRLNETDSVEEGEEESADNSFVPVPGVPLRWYNALLPVVTVVGVTLAGLIHTGTASSYAQIVEAGGNPAAETVGAIWPEMYRLTDATEISTMRKFGLLIGNADSYIALLWASLSGLILALGLSFAQRIFKLQFAMESMVDGFKAMLPAMLILTFAWALSTVTEDLHTAEYLTSLFSGNVSPGMMPAITFILAAAIAFSTGSSWGTMAILYPLILPATWSIAQAAGLPQAEAMAVMYHVIAVVLGGAVFGDHCSPISDTTILSSLASSCHHIAHVRTQLPYAATVAGVSLLMSILMFNLGARWWLNYPLGLAILFLIVRFVGKPVETEEAPTRAHS
ncbi:Na+/H+ antiporter NhaC [Catalinimonas alkaloidigena]|uniref:Na+/H+ antiporter NhaC n=1 Tax=Catalinimonas alkaloidigena TaxID=1075417 RepID=A0A1G9PK71_9BACT|nr:Na+/H+ antiporter NhaC family protein [Catalinimonas alkaloidigena]SDL99119.1 Na+/H+ antiporter NhaC [Catalinimonas alkaloidigena]